MHDPKAQILEAIYRGKIFLHPAGTLPGLGWDVTRAELWESILEMKGRPTSKPVIGLVASLDQACKFWKQISGCWLKALESSWPGPLTVIGPASWSSPISGVDSTLALRVPKFSNQDAWMFDVLRELNFPLPSTSVNKSGESPALNWPDAVEFSLKHQVFVPELGTLPEFVGLPSTVIKIIDDTSYQVVRKGAFELAGFEHYGLRNVEGS